MMSSPMKSFFELVDNSFGHNMISILYGVNYLYQNKLMEVNEPGLTVRQIAELMAGLQEVETESIIRKTRYHMGKLEEGSLVEKYAGLVDGKAVGLYKPTRRFRSFMECLGLDKEIRKFVEETLGDSSNYGKTEAGLQ